MSTPQRFTFAGDSWRPDYGNNLELEGKLARQHVERFTPYRERRVSMHCSATRLAPQPHDDDEHAAWSCHFESCAGELGLEVDGGDVACSEPSPRERYVAALRWAATWSRLHELLTARLVGLIEARDAELRGKEIRRAHRECGRALARACEARRRAFDAAVVAAMTGGR